METMSESATVGRVACLVCGQMTAVSLSRGRQFAFMSCDECGSQLYTRNRPASRMLEGQATGAERQGPPPAPPSLPVPPVEGAPRRKSAGIDEWLRS